MKTNWTPVFAFAAGIVVGSLHSVLSQQPRNPPIEVTQNPPLPICMPGGVTPSGLVAMLRLDVEGRVIAKCER